METTGSSQWHTHAHCRDWRFLPPPERRRTNRRQQTLHAFLEHMIGLGLVQVGEMGLSVTAKARAPSKPNSYTLTKAIWAPGIEETKAVVTVVGDGQVLVDPRNAQPHHTRIASRFNRTTGHDHVVILLPDHLFQRQ